MAAPKGHKRYGGRKKGSVNKVTAAMKAEIAATGETPLQFMLRAMRDTDLPFITRIDVAKAAAPYIHPRLQAVEHTGKDGGPMEYKNADDEQLDADIRRVESEIASDEAGEAPSLNGSSSTLRNHNGSL